jgi:hypothetical protein
MDHLQLTTVKKLASVHEPNCITICFSTHLSSNDQHQDILRLKNLTDQVERELMEGEVDEREIRRLKETLQGIGADHQFWQSRGRGLAIFLKPQEVRCYRVPIELEEMAVVSDRFQIKPLLPLFNESMKVYVLVLSQHQVRLLEKTEFYIEEVNLELPQRLEETLNLQCADGAPQSHFANVGGHGKGTSVFHGHGGKKDTHKEELKLFFRIIDEVVERFTNSQPAPLVLAGVDYLLPLYREVSHCKDIIDQELIGNWDDMSLRELQERLQPLLVSKFSEQRKRVAERYNDLRSSGRSTDELKHALRGAFQGRIDVLFVDTNRHLWGRCDKEGENIEVHPTRQAMDNDLLDLLAGQAMVNGGKVYAVMDSDMPSHGSLAAIFRY